MPNLVQVPQPEEARLWQVGSVWFVMYRVPRIDVPMVWKIEDDKELDAIWNGSGPPKPNRKLTWEQFKKVGALRFGSSRELANLTGHPIDAFFSDFKKEAEVQPWLRDEEVLAITLAATLEGRQPTQAELATTEWFRSRNEAQRAWIALRASDPETAGQVLFDNHRRIRDSLIKAGITNPPDWLNWALTSAFTRGDLTESGLSQAIRKIVDPTAPGTIPSAVLNNELWKGRGGNRFAELRNLERSGAGEERVRALVRKWLGPQYGNWTDAQISQWAAALRNNPDAEEELTATLRDQLHSVYSEREIQDPNVTWDTLAQPWINMAQRTWGNQVNPSDPVVDRLIRLNDGAEAGKYLRKEGLSRGNETTTRQLNAAVNQVFGQSNLAVRPML